MEEPKTEASDFQSSELSKRGGLSYVLASALVFGLVLLLGIAVSMAYNVSLILSKVP